MLRDQQNAITYTIKCPALFLNNTNNVLEKKKIAFVECWEEATASQYEVGDVEVEVDRVKRRSAERDQKIYVLRKFMISLCYAAAFLSYRFFLHSFFSHVFLECFSITIHNTFELRRRFLRSDIFFCHSTNLFHVSESLFSEQWDNTRYDDVWMCASTSYQQQAVLSAKEKQLRVGKSMEWVKEKNSNIVNFFYSYLCIWMCDYTHSRLIRLFHFFSFPSASISSFRKEEIII